MESRTIKFPTRGSPALAARDSLQPKANQKWFTGPVAVSLIILPILIILFEPPVHRMGMLLAYGNVLIVGIAMTYFIRQRTFESSVPILFLSWLLFAWPVSSIYFGVFDPEIAYTTVRETHEPLLEGNVRLQAVTMAFLTGYLATIVLLNRRKWSRPPSFSVSNPATARMALVATVLSLLVITGKIISSFTSSNSLIKYLVDGTFLFLYAVPLILGVLGPKISWSLKVLTFGFLGAASLVFILFNARFYALVPWVMIFVGYLLFGEVSSKKKSILLAVGLVLFPLALVVGDTVRTLSKGRQATLSLEERRDLFSNWRDWLSRDSVLNRAFSRMFSASGHAIITRTPEEVPYLEFDPARFLGEYFAVVFIPNRFYYDPFYSSTYRLNDYDHRVNEFTSEELSLPGSLWMLGGIFPLVLGSIATGLIHTGVMIWIRRATRKSPYQGLFYLAMIAGTIMFAFNLDLISHTRAVIRGMAIAIVLWYCVVTWVLGRTQRSLPPMRSGRLAMGVIR